MLSYFKDDKDRFGNEEKAYISLTQQVRMDSKRKLETSFATITNNAIFGI